MVFINIFICLPRNVNFTTCNISVSDLPVCEMLASGDQFEYFLWGDDLKRK